MKLYILLRYNPTGGMDLIACALWPDDDTMLRGWKHILRDDDFINTYVAANDSAGEARIENRPMRKVTPKQPPFEFKIIPPPVW